MIKTKHWILIFGLLLAAAVLILVLTGGGKKQALTARIFQDGTLMKEIALQEVAEGFFFRIEDGQGHYNLICVEPGRIAIREADCPDGLCVKQGWCSQGPASIVCLPHRLIIELDGGE